MKLSVVIPAYNAEDTIVQALDSVPCRGDVEIIAVDDGSSDRTLNLLLEFQNNHPERKVEVLHNAVNRGVSYTINRGMDVAIGDYIVLLGSDDWFITDELNKVIDRASGEDLVYFNLKINSGNIWRLNNDTKWTFCGSVKLMRREFIGNIRNKEEKRAHEDAYFFAELQAKNPTEVFTNIVAKRYNHPREGSLSSMVTNGKINGSQI